MPWPNIPPHVSRPHLPFAEAPAVLGRGSQDQDFGPDGAGTQHLHGSSCSAAQRVVQAGGMLQQLVVDYNSVIPFERLYRRLPEEGMFDASVSPQRPFTFELGAFQVEQNSSLLLFDLRPDIYRLSGLDAGDFLPVVPRRFGSLLGFDVNVDQQRSRMNLQYELDPIQIQTTKQAFTSQATPLNQTTVIPNPGIDNPTPFAGGAPQVTPNSVYNISAANSFGNAAGVGDALMPQRPRRPGAEAIPFTMIVRAGQTVQVNCVIFRPLPSPIAFIEYDLAGLLVPSNWEAALMSCSRPITGAGT